ncbi:MAG TPA: hypothetical protein DCG19_06005 [Cryomorphaceae bacterium]|nr:hypothetical protein [Owenweeksia sp.]MBF98955.1 hypothetical protein [Owenweeksia sp.]HAD96940.1 hypothetical protein [Cryomorphaceae bacterium]HBF21929.1 hypothetical protein [Cryomorphaceae bacterium]|tara:strand:- start:163 stop:612 length:450 start_codon:yes stop_codon:yes gene_type:complete
MKKLFLTLSFVAAGLLAVAQEAETNPNAPAIEFEKDVIDYGTIEQGANGERVFVFKNTGKEPLIITSAKGSCGCTVPTPPKEPIAPGETGELKVKYDTKRIGPFTKSVTVNSNASNGTQQLRIKGTVKQKEEVKTSPEKEGQTSLLEQK